MEMDFCEKIEDALSCSRSLNVTRQLQCAVENSKLILPSGESKYFQVDGVFDPAVGESKGLWVRYYFRGIIHQVFIKDEARLMIPLKSHCSKRKTRAMVLPEKPSVVKAVLRITGTCVVLGLAGLGVVMLHDKPTLLPAYLSLLQFKLFKS